MDIVAHFRDSLEKEAEEIRRQEDEMMDMGYDY
jgi:hypothetical protein